MLVWAFPVAGALAEGIPSAILGGANGPTPIYASESLNLTGIIEAQLPWYSFGPMDERALKRSRRESSEPSRTPTPLPGG